MLFIIRKYIYSVLFSFFTSFLFVQKEWFFVSVFYEGTYFTSMYDQYCCVILLLFLHFYFNWWKEKKRK